MKKGLSIAARIDIIFVVLLVCNIIVRFFNVYIPVLFVLCTIAFVNQAYLILAKKLKYAKSYQIILFIAGFILWANIGVRLI